MAILRTKHPKRDRRVPVNLSLSKDALRQGRALQRILQRPSLSNVVEYLIAQADKEAA